MSSGCNTMKELWKIADVNCKIGKPGVSGSVDRTTNFVECTNLRDFMVIASLKCWEERGTNEERGQNNDFPPIVVVNDEKTSYDSASSSKSSKK